MSADEIARLEEAAKELTAVKSLERIDAHQQFLVGNLSLIATLLAVAGGITGAVTITRTTEYWGGVPVVPVGALLASSLAGLSIVAALISRTPRLDQLNVNDAHQVKKFFEEVVKKRAVWLFVATALFMVAVLTAVGVAGIAGYSAITDSPQDPKGEPVNRATLAATVGAAGAVTLTLGGTVTNLDDNEKVTMKVETSTTGGSAVSILDLTAYPDAQGSIAFESSATASVGSDQAVGTLTITDRNGGEVGEPQRFELSYPKVPPPPPKE